MTELKYIFEKYHIHDFVFVDVGAKDFLDFFPEIAAMTHVHGFEPTPEEFHKLKERYNQHPFKALYLRELGLSDKQGEAEFWITDHASMSSLLEPDTHNYSKHFGKYKEYKHWEKSIQANKKIKIALDTADAYFKDFPDPIDYMKIDTQGSELLILRGAEGLLKQRKINVLKVEVSTIPIYKDQAVFSDIDQFLRSHDFTLVDFMTYRDTYKPVFGSSKNHAHYAPCGDAIYVLNDRNEDQETRIRKGLILSWLGYRSLAIHFLQDAGLSASEIAIMNEIPSVQDKSFFSGLLMNITPPALYRLMKKIQWRLRK